MATEQTHKSFGSKTTLTKKDLIQKSIIDSDRMR